MTIKIKYGLKELEKEYGPLTFGNMLHAHRLGEEMSQVEMAKLLGISKSSLCDIEKGRKIPSPKRAALIAKMLKEHEEFFISIALQDAFRKDNLNFTVEVKKKVKKAS